MRILHLGKFYPPQRGGMESALRDLCHGLHARGHEVTAVVASPDATHHSEWLQGVRVERVPSFGTLRSVPVCPELPGTIRRLKNRFRPDLIQLHLPNPGAAAAWWIAARDTRLVISYHSDIVRQRLLSAAWQPWRRQVLARARAIVVSSEDLLLASDTLAAHRDRCHVIPFFVDPDWFDAVPRQDVQTAAEAWGERFFLFVGRHVYYKGVPILLEALDGTDLRAVVVGDGPLREEWEEMARTRALAPNVRFVGEVPSAQLRALLHTCTALVLPSTAPSETFGIVQLEAMACRRPVVVSRASAGAASVQIDGETGLVVPPGDAPALRAALTRLWNDPGACQRMGQAGWERVRAFYDREKVLDRWQQLLTGVVSGDAEPLRSSP